MNYFSEKKMKFLTLLLLAAVVYARTTEEEKDDSISRNDENRNPVDDNKDANVRGGEARDSDAGLTSTITRLKLKNQGPHPFSNQLLFLIII